MNCFALLCFVWVYTQTLVNISICDWMEKGQNGSNKTPNSNKLSEWIIFIQRLHENFAYSSGTQVFIKFYVILRIVVV